jgi:hypothetical protein
VSKGGGVLPLWRPDGNQLFYAGDSIMAVDIDTSKGFQPSLPRPLFLSPSPVVNRGWALAPDGKRFLMAVPADDVRTIPFTVVVNWVAALKK